eukprot:CAMPEP_0116079070 /NCGR_PEP_ID=MMETSP0327-20121206/947_1 /TAXON_ID=44447 /ORGANISM="Pseudo-nitzschia delicatissima, Strain B596" /LENGTH=605 /DNA_ID=CAMNT_0003569673 /DNA_START=72 /DNA_END=1886 /DNA_ORIENTATION=-
MAQFNNTQRPTKGGNKLHANRNRIKTLILILLLSLWSYWIMYCQPLNKYEIETKPSTTIETKTTTTTTSSASSSTIKKVSTSQPEVKNTETTEAEGSGTAVPTDNVEESAENGENEIGIDEAEQSSEDDDASKSEDEGIRGMEEDIIDNIGIHDIGIDEEAKEKDQKNQESGSDKDKDKDGGDEDGMVTSESDGDTISTDERFENHKYMFIHIGKAGGSTLQGNIFDICIRKNTEQNLMRRKRKGDPRKKVGAISCIRALKKQAESNPTTEMVISNDRVVGYMHMNWLNYWWNANDDGEVIDDSARRKGNIQDEITAILSFGTDNAWNISAIRDPPKYEKKDDGMTKSTAFLVPIRDPIDRFVSAFNYHHPNNQHQKVKCDNKPERFLHWVSHSFYCDCFNTVNDLVEAVTSTGDPKYVPLFKKPDQKIACLEIADRVLRGRSSYKLVDGHANEEKLWEDQDVDLELIRTKKWYSIGHLTFNYGYYYRRAFLKYPQKDIVAIRTEHMWEDLQNLEYKLGGSALVQGNATGHKTVTHGSSKFGASEKLKDAKGIQVICCAISSESLIYIELLVRAVNLSREQKKESLTAFGERCNLELCAKPSGEW